MNGLEQTAARIRARYYPSDRRPYHDWVERTISTSKLIPNTAADYAASLIAHRDEVEAGDEVNHKWGFLGNTIADAALADMDAHENNLLVPLGPCGLCDACQVNDSVYHVYPSCLEEWSWTGHFDGASANPDGVVIGEHKFYLYNEAPARSRNAMRQGMSYLAMAWRMLQTITNRNPALGAYVDAGLVPGEERRIEECLVFRPAAYGPPHAVAFRWPKSLPPLGVVVALSPSHTCEARIETYPLGPDECEQVVEFYLSKARAIRDAYLERNISIAQAWDAAHPAENIRPLSDVMAGRPLPDLDVLVDELVQVKAKLTPPPLPLEEREVDLLESREAELRKLVLLKMGDLGERRVDRPGYRINRQVTEERIKPAQAEQVIPASAKLVVTAVKAKEPKQVLA